MRSSPLLLMLLLLLGFGGLAVPLARLTQARPAIPPPPPPVPTTGTLTDTHLRFRFAHQPLRISLKQNDRLITAFDTPGENPTELITSLAQPEQGVELLVEATWPAGTPSTALTVELEPDGFEGRSATRWTDTGTLTEVFSFSWQ